MKDYAPPLTLRELGRILGEEFGTPREDIRMDAVLRDLRLNSLDLIELVNALNIRYGTAVAARDVDPDGTVRDVLHAFSRCR
ncbi:acyl carrier protein [Streptomyces sp. NPDC026672]|uniref:acyl carrier protein n=1 Tax=unclassified Streptomyces TaxID=2593676 RepID=UPI003401C73D